jgi:hypothetical protein
VVESGIVLGAVGGVALLTTDAVWFRDGGSFVLGALGLRWRGRLAGGAVDVEVSTFAHCNGSFVTPMGVSLLGGRVPEFCTGIVFVMGKLGAGATTSLGFGGARFRFWPPSGAAFAEMAGDGAIFIASEP